MSSKKSKKQNLLKLKLKLKNISSDDYDNIKQLTKIQSVMRYVGNGQTWNDNKLNNFIKYNLIEQKLNDNKRDNYYYKIVNENSKTKIKSKIKSKSKTKPTKSKETFIGIIGFHKFPQVKDYKNYYLTIFIDPKHQNKGYFSQSIDLLSKKVKKHKPNLSYLISLTHKTNINMIKISNHKFTYDKDIKFKGSILKQFLIFLDLGNNKYHKKFYLVKSNYLKRKTVSTVFYNINKSMGYQCWEQFNLKYPQINNPTFLYIDGNHIQNKLFWKYQPSIKNLVDDNKYKIGDKEQLFNNITKLYDNKIPIYLSNQINFDITKLNKSIYERILKLFKDNAIWIMKPVDGYAGEGIRIIEDRAQCTNYLKEIRSSKTNAKSKSKNNKKSKSFKNWVLQEYIDNPLLFKNKKFHIRAYFLYIAPNQGYLLDIGKIFTAKNNYTKSNYQNQDIHDTHLKSTPNPLYFERDFVKEFGVKKARLVVKQMLKIFKDILKCIDAKCYSESPNCYELFGVDLMIDEEFVVKLIEVNTKIGLGSYPNDKVDINKIIFENVLDTVLGNFNFSRFIKL